MTEIATLETAPASEPAERKMPDGVVKLENAFAKAGRPYTMTAPTEGLALPPMTDEGDGRRGYVMALVLGGDGRMYPLFEMSYSVGSFLRNWDWFEAYHVLALPEGSDAHAIFRDQIQPVVADNPWLGKAWFRENLARWAEHLPVPSETVQGNLAYYQSPAKRARDVRTPIKPGRYLKKYFGDLLSEAEIHEAALEWQNHFALRKLVVTQDADEIEAVYRGRYNGSCMHFGNGGYAGPEHPSRVYAGPDLGIAYIGAMNDADARCLVWPEKKIYYAKWYGDGARLEASLEAEGYRSAGAHEFMGARIQRIEADRGAFVVPYVDVCDYADDGGEYLILGGSEVYLRNTSGISNELDECEDCGAPTHENDLTWVHGGDYRVCPSCLEENYFLCDAVDDYYHEDRRVPTPEGYNLSDYGYERYDHRWFYCEHSELHYPHRDFNEIDLIEGGTCEEGFAEANGWQCEFSEEWSLETDGRVVLTDGSVVHPDYLDSPGFADWMAERGASLGTMPHPDQLDMLEAA